MKIVRLTLLCVFCSVIGLQAQVPGTLSYQGILMQSDGITPLADGAHSIVFNFYATSSGGAAVFSRTISVTTTKGLYTCIIGGGTAPNAPFNTTEKNQVSSQQIFIGITVDGGSELSPRAQLTTGPYSLRAESLTNTATPAGGYVAFWGANNSQSADAALFWNGTARQLAITGTPSPSNMDTEAQLWFQRQATGGVKNTNTAEIRVTTFEPGILGRTSMQFWLSGLPQSENTFGTVAEMPVLTLNANDGGGGSNNNGYVGIGITNPSYNLHVNGSICYSGGACASDIRFKKNITTIQNGLNKIVSLTGVSFDWRYNEFNKSFKKTRDIGFIAQDVQKVLPELVTSDNDGYLSVDYEKITAVLTEAMKEQQTQIENLKAANQNLERRLQALEGHASNTKSSLSTQGK